MSQSAARLIACAGAAMLAALAQTASPPADPSAVTENMQKQDRKLATAWLQADDPRTQAWGAYLAVRSRLSDLAPSLLGVLSTYSQTDPPATMAETDQRDTMMAVLDALIELGIEVHAADASKLYSQFPTQSLILLSRSHEDTGSFLLSVFENNPVPVGGWLAAGNLLATQRAPGFAAAVLRGMTVRATVTVQTPGGPGYGRGSSSCCGAGISPQPKPGWPPVGNYALSNCTSPGIGSTILAAGPDPAYYSRAVNTYYTAGTSACGCYPDPDLVRQHYLATLLQSPPETPPIKAAIAHHIEWQDAGAYQTNLRAFIAGQQQTFANVAQRLNASGLMTAEEAASARPALAIEIWDQRSAATPLPAITDIGDRVTMKDSSF